MPRFWNVCTPNRWIFVILPHLLEFTLLLFSNTVFVYSLLCFILFIFWRHFMALVDNISEYSSWWKNLALWTYMTEFFFLSIKNVLSIYSLWILGQTSLLAQWSERFLFQFSNSSFLFILMREWIRNMFF